MVAPAAVPVLCTRETNVRVTENATAGLAKGGTKLKPARHIATRTKSRTKTLVAN